jgi:predicted transposase YdaD
MTILRESPWYEEIFQEGLEQGLEQGMEQGLEQGLERGQVNTLLRVLERRFGALPADLVVRIRRLPGEQILPVVDVALEAPSLNVVIDYLETLPTSETGENE